MRVLDRLSDGCFNASVFVRDGFAFALGRLSLRCYGRYCADDWVDEMEQVAKRLGKKRTPGTGHD